MAIYTLYKTIKQIKNGDYDKLTSVLEKLILALYLTFMLLLVIYYATVAKHYCELMCQAEGMKFGGFSNIGARCECYIPPKQLTNMFVKAGEKLRVNVTSGYSRTPSWMQKNS